MPYLETQMIPVNAYVLVQRSAQYILHVYMNDMKFGVSNKA